MPEEDITVQKIRLRCKVMKFDDEELLSGEVSSTDLLDQAVEYDQVLSRTPAGDPAYNLLTQEKNRLFELSALLETVESRR